MINMVNKINLDKAAANLFLFISLFSYPLINRVFDGKSGLLQDINKSLWFFLTPLLLIFLSRKIPKSLDLTDKLFIFSTFYLLLSLLMFSIFNNVNVNYILLEMSYSTLPIFCYFIFKYNKNIDSKNTLKFIIYLITVVIICGFWSQMDIPKPSFIEAIKNTKSLNFQSFYSPIILASIAPICLGIVLFKYINFSFLQRYFLIILFFITSILTIQRAALLGCFMCLVFYLFYKIKLKNLFIVFVILLMLLIIASSVISFYKDSSGYEMILNEINSFSITQVLYERREQLFIFNDSNIFSILFGEGYGKYSPQNDLAKLIMPDASYLRLYNELGIIGTIVFFSPFISAIIFYIKNKNWLFLYIILFVLIHFYFNRILMSLPAAYFIYTILGMSFNLLLSNKKMLKYH